MIEPTHHSGQSKSSGPLAVSAAFLGWTIDSFDFFVVVMTLSAIAADFGVSRPQVALTLTATLFMRPVGAFAFGLLADRYGRRPLLVANVLFYTVMEVASGFAPDYTTFFILRMLYGIGMGGNWGVGASLALESVPAKWRGTVSGLLQEGYSFGNLLAAIAYFTIFPVWGWRAMFFVGAIPALLTVALCLKVSEPEAWKEQRTNDWGTYKAAVFGNLPRFGYMILLMTMMTFISHGTQDMYPTYLQRQRHFDVPMTAIITSISMIGAMMGGLVGGTLSNRLGRRRMIVIALLLCVCVIPLWVGASITPLVMVGAYLMQFMVQAAWGVIPAHLTELSPGPLRGIFPGLSYQLGVVLSSSVGWIEAELGEHFSYTASMGGLAAVVLLIGAVVVWKGPEAKDVSFRKQPAPETVLTGK
ncbi:MAG: MFS transporter [Bryobacterales bacterium]|nr:MFS transporter [Bryobacterales bacterium]